MSMRVITQDSFGGPEVLRVEDRPTSEPLPTEIRVRVEAAGINPVDWKTRAGGGVAGLLGEPPFRCGVDFTVGGVDAQPVPQIEVVPHLDRGVGLVHVQVHVAHPRAQHPVVGLADPQLQADRLQRQDVRAS